MNVIVNVDANWAIGYKGQLLFPVREDLKRFARLTTGKVVVMGRLTLESLPGGRPLKNRENIVLSKSFFSAAKGAAPDEGAQGTAPDANLSFCASAADLKNLLAAARFAAYKTDDIFVIGGQSVYEQLLDECDTAYITRIDGAAPNADAFFPNLDKKPAWQIAESSEVFFQDGIAYRYVTYKKISNPA